MNAQTIRRKYFEYLIDIVANDKQKIDYHSLFEALHETQFDYFIDNDVNRAIDGIILRHEFGDSYGLSKSEIDDVFYEECTVLEMLVAFSRRIESEITGDEWEGLDYGKWFWIMLENIGLKNQTDDEFDRDYVDDVLVSLLERDYNHDGSCGSLFPVKNPKRDMRRIELWYQMSQYLNENL